MDLSESAIVAALFVLALGLRVVPSAFRGHYGNDSYYHLFTARVIKGHGRLPAKDTGMTPENTYGYPPLLHVLLVPFVGRLEKAALRYFGPLVDSASVIVVFALAAHLGLDHPVIPAAIVAISPMAVLQGASLNPRPLGNLALSAGLVSGLVFLTDGNMLFLSLLALAEAAVMLSHKMSLQAMLVAHPAVAIAAVVYDPLRGVLLLLALPAALTLATALTKGQYLTTTLKDHIRFVKVHVRRGDYSTGRKELPSPIRNLKSDPVSFSGPFVGFLMMIDGGMTEPLAFLVLWSAAILGIASLWPWGDAWRHLAFGTVPSAALLAMWVEGLDLDGWTRAALLVMLMSGLATITVIQLRRTTLGDKAAAYVSAMEGLPKDWRDRLRGATVCSNVIHYSLAYILGARCLGGNPNSAGMEVNFRIMETGSSSIESMAALSKELTGSEPDFILLFDDGPSPREDGFRTVHKGPGLRILARDA